MNKEIKKRLGITFGITIAMLLLCYILIKAKSDKYMELLEKLGEDMGPDEYMYGGAFIGVVLAIAGSILTLLAYPLLPTTVYLALSLIIILIVKREKHQRIVLLIHLILYAILGVLTLLVISYGIILFATSALSSPSPLLSFALVILLILTAISLVSHFVNSIVCEIKLGMFCRKQRREEREARLNAPIDNLNIEQKTPQ